MWVVGLRGTRVGTRRVEVADSFFSCKFYTLDCQHGNSYNGPFAHHHLNTMDNRPALSTAGRLEQPLLVRRQKSAIDGGAWGRLEPSTNSESAEFSVTNGVWEAPDDGLRTATDLGFGIKFLQHHCSSHPDKLLEYETEQLESRPFSIILERRHGTQRE